MSPAQLSGATSSSPECGDCGEPEKQSEWASLREHCVLIQRRENLETPAIPQLPVLAGAGAHLRLADF